jgi:lipoyl(octanoyl) transferase
MRWKLLHTPPLRGAENMALDHALLDRARRTGEAVFRVYSWANPTLSFGRNQSVRGVFDPDRAKRAGIDVVRRPTGGRAVLHHREITYSVSSPVSPDEPLRESYSRINRLLVDGLARLGVRADVASPVERAPRPGASPCFEVPSAGELVVNGRKLVASAQWRDRDALVQHGSLLIEDDQGTVASLASRPIPSAVPAATLHDSLGRSPAIAEVVTALFSAVRDVEDPSASELGTDDSLESELAAALEQYDNDAWTWRR